MLLTVLLFGCAGAPESHAAAPQPTAAEKEAAAVEAQFGPKIKAAMSTYTNEEDNLAVAGEMLEAAKKETKNADRIEALCERVFALGSKTWAAAGDDLAEQAGRMIIAARPARKLDLLDQIYVMRQKRFNNSVKAADKLRWGDATIRSMLESAEAHMYAELFADSFDRYKQANRVATNYKGQLGPRIAAAHEFCINRQKLMTEVHALEQKVKMAPADSASADRLVFLHLIELNDPVSAARYVGSSKDARARAVAPLAAKADKDLDAAGALAVADYYRELSEKASKPAFAPIVLRSYKLYERYLELEKKQDQTRYNAVQSLRAVEKIMAANQIEIPSEQAKVAKLPAGADPLGRFKDEGPDSVLKSALQAPLDMRKGADNPTEWIDLLKAVDPKKHQMVGDWPKTREGNLAGAFTDHNSHLWLPLRIKGGYDLQVGFRFDKGDGAFQFSLPVGANRVSLLLSTTHPELSGLEMIDGKTSIETGTLLKPFPLKAGQEYTIRVTVDVKGEQAELSAILNNVAVIKWTGLAASLTAPSKWLVSEPGCPGIGVDPTGADAFEATFNHARARIVNGEAETVIK